MKNLELNSKRIRKPLMLPVPDKKVISEIKELKKINEKNLFSNLKHATNQISNLVSGVKFPVSADNEIFKPNVSDMGIGRFYICGSDECQSTHGLDKKFEVIFDVGYNSRLNICKCEECKNTKHIFHPIRDNPTLSSEDVESFARCLYDFADVVNSTNGDVLVMCRKGISRSPSVLYAHVVLKRFSNMTSDDKRTVIENFCCRRDVVEPSYGFILITDVILAIFNRFSEIDIKQINSLYDEHSYNSEFKHQVFPKDVAEVELTDLFKLFPGVVELYCLMKLNS